MTEDRNSARRGESSFENDGPTSAGSSAPSAGDTSDSGDDPFALAEGATNDPGVHRYGKGERRICRTEERGHSRPRGRTPFEIVVDASEGFIPLWTAGSTLRYRFNARSLKHFRQPEVARAALCRLLGEALIVWGDAVPIRFSERASGVDFEIVMRNADDCDPRGCTLARAFFPGSARNQLVLYPKLFQQPRAEQLETLVHELGHVFGLRHFFAPVSETDWASHIFGTHNRFTIMNYGADSVVADADRADLKALYEQAWSGKLKDINGTPIRFFKPYSAAA